MRNTFDDAIVDAEDDVVDAETPIDVSGAALNDFRNENAGVVADVRVVSTSRYAEAQSRGSSFQSDFVVLPLFFLSTAIRTTGINTFASRSLRNGTNYIRLLYEKRPIFSRG